MKNSFRLLIILLLSQQFTHAQTVYAGNDGAMRFFEMRDDQGALIKTASEMGVKGSPMIQDGWAAGTIHFKNGLTFYDTLMNFSLFTNKLYIARNNRYLELVQPASSFTLNFRNESGSMDSYLFKNGYPAIEDHDSSFMYEVLYAGENLQLLSWQHKKVIETFNYGSPHEKEYAIVQKLYVYLPKEKKMTPLSSYAVQAAKKSLPDYADNIQAYAASHKLNGKDKTQFVDLLSYLDKNH
jgi:hypothetical protein